MTGARARRVAESVAALALVGCASSATGSATPVSSPNYLQQYENAGAALDTATTTWDTLGQSLVAAGTNTVANEAPINASYALALQTFGTALLGIQFPVSTQSDVHAVVSAAAIVRGDLVGVASGAVPTTQFASDESHLEATINLVQRDLGPGSSTPIAGG